MWLTQSLKLRCNKLFKNCIMNYIFRIISGLLQTSNEIDFHNLYVVLLFFYRFFFIFLSVSVSFISSNYLIIYDVSLSDMWLTVNNHVVSSRFKLNFWGTMKEWLTTIIPQVRAIELNEKEGKDEEIPNQIYGGNKKKYLLDFY